MKQTETREEVVGPESDPPAVHVRIEREPFTSTTDARPVQRRPPSLTLAFGAGDGTVADLADRTHLSTMDSPLDGHWALIRAEMDGQLAPQLVVQRTRLVLSRGRYTVLFSGDPADGGTFAVIASGTTATLLLQGEVGHNAGRNIPCLFQQVGDRLRICYGLDGTLPSRFGAAAGEARYLATYRRGNPLDEGDEAGTDGPDSPSD